MIKSGFLTFIAVLVLSGCSTADLQPPSTLGEGEQADDELALAPGEACPVSSIIEDFWDAAGPFAGEYPAWMTTLGRQPWSDRSLLPNVLPPSDGSMDFEYGFVTKALVALSQEVEGDLYITGRQLDGNRVVYFPEHDGLIQISDTELQVVAPPAEQLVIEDAHIQSRSPNPLGMAHHGLTFMVIGPGCYAFDLHVRDHTTRVIIEFYE